MDKPSPINELMHRSDFPADGVLQRGQFLHRLNRLIRSLLDDESKLHCQVGNIRDGVLILYADSTAWASRLRYQSTALLQQLQARKGLAQLNKIDVKVLPKQNKSTENHGVSMSKEASSCLMQCAEAMPESELSNALRRLATHHNKER